MAKPKVYKKEDKVKKNAVLKPLASTTLLLLSLLALAGITYLVFTPCLTAGFTNWDDKRYIFESPMIRALTWANIKIMFTEKVLMSYNPLVILSFAMEYTTVGQKPELYHFVNVLLHIANSLLLALIFKKLSGKLEVGLIVSALFALHPMHVESVAWIASRKDVLFTLFYFLAWFSYLHFFTKNNKWQFYFLTILAFLLSILSKSQAVTLPIILLMSQWFYNKTITKKDLILLIPFFILSLAAGAFTLQGSSGVADKYAVPFSFVEKGWYSIMAIGIYLYKSILPFNQTAIYAFPKTGSPDFSIQLIIGIVLIVLSIFAAWYYRKKFPVIAWGLLFFYVHIFLVLHLVATNSSLIYERFTYISYIGLFFIIAEILSNTGQTKKQSVSFLILILISVSAYATYSRCKIWKNSETLWSDIILKNQQSETAYNNRGEYYYQQGELEKALADYNEGIRIQPNQPSPYNNRAIIYYKRKQYDLALKDIEKALSIEPEYAAAYNNKGNIYYNIPDYDSAIVAFQKAVTLFENYPTAWCNLGSSYLQKGDLQSALTNYKKALQYDPNYDEPIRYMGLAYMRMDSLDLAYQYFTKAQQLNPSSEALKILSDEYLKRGSKAFTERDIDKSLSLYNKASEVMPDYAEPYYCIGGVWLAKGDVNKAREFWTRTLQIDPNHKEAQTWLAKIGR